MSVTSFFRRITLPKSEEAEALKVDYIEKEFTDGFDIKRKYPKTVTFYGSARSDSADKHYQHAETLAERVASELGYTVVTGGGLGIMEAANKGAAKSGAKTLGFNIKLPHEQTINSYVTENMEFKHFFARKVLLSYMTKAYIFYPGGFGTLDEFFEVLTLIQTNKAPRRPIVLVGNDFWIPLRSFIETHLYKHHASISDVNLDLFVVEENFDKIIEILKEDK